VIEKVAAGAIPGFGLLHLVFRPEKDDAAENTAECVLQSFV
jgi:hypothetical protein